ncbi:hypothetical protein Vafri_2346, partial [Volvox africanus]
LATALRRVGLWDALAAAAVHRRRHGGGGSALPVTAAEVLALPLGALPGAVGLSAGQQQLLCLSRLLLRPRRLVLLDECSAHVDPATATTIRRLVSEQILQRTLRPPPGTMSTGPLTGTDANVEPDNINALSPDPQLQTVLPQRSIDAATTAAAGPTAVLEVAHDLKAIGSCDRVVVMEAGRAVEEGPPGQLAVQVGARFRALCLAAGFTVATAAAESAGGEATAGRG